MISLNLWVEGGCPSASNKLGFHKQSSCARSEREPVALITSVEALIFGFICDSYQCMAVIIHKVLEIHSMLSLEVTPSFLGVGVAL